MKKILIGLVFLLCNGLMLGTNATFTNANDCTSVCFGGDKMIGTGRNQMWSSDACSDSIFDNGCTDCGCVTNWVQQ